MRHRRSLALLLAVAAPLAWAETPASAQDYPARPIRLLVTSPAGSLVDVLSRILTQDLGARLGQNIIVDNRPGGMTLNATDALVRSPPDGYTLMLGTGEMAFLPFLKKNYRYDPIKDFTPIALVTTSWTVFAVNPKVPAQTLPELVSYAKANPKAIRYGSGGVGGALHIAVEMLKLKTGADFVHIPYRGGSQVATDAISGQIEMASMGLASTRIADQGQLRILAQTGPVRHPMLPNVPTTAEAGLPDVRMDTWFGVIGPPNMPPAVTARLVRAIDEVVHEKAFEEKLFKIGCAVAWKPQAEFANYIAEETKKWSQIIPAMGIKIDE
jgi:tripartite-type tricarboxylate transporter receptor subunit TctC